MISPHEPLLRDLSIPSPSPMIYLLRRFPNRLEKLGDELAQAERVGLNFQSMFWSAFTSLSPSIVF